MTWSSSSTARRGEPLLLALLAASAPPAPLLGGGPVTGEGRVRAAPDDPPGLVRRLLLHAAFRDAAGKRLREMGLDDREFWRRRGERFEEHFGPVAEKVREGFAGGGGGGLAAALRRRRALEEAAYGNLAGVVSSYAVRSGPEAAPGDPRSRRMTVSATIDPRALHRMYVRFTSAREAGPFGALLLSVSFSLTDMEWSDVGGEGRFAGAVAGKWADWFRENAGGVFGETVVVGGADRARLEEALAAPAGGGPVAPGLPGDALWLSVHVDVEGAGGDGLLGRRDFRIGAGAVLSDPGTGAVLAHADVPAGEHGLSDGDPALLASDLATAVHRKLAGSLAGLRDAAAAAPREGGRMEVSVAGAAGALDLVELSDHLSEAGVAHGLAPRIVRYDGREARMELAFSGPREALLRFLGGLDGREFADGRALSLDGPSRLRIVGDGGG